MTKSLHEGEQLYHLVFPGHVLPGSDHDDVVFKLSRLLNTTPYRAAKLVAGKKRYIKRAFFREQAEKLHAQILKLGVECNLETVNDISSSQLKRKLEKHKTDPHKEDFPDPESHDMQLSHPEDEGNGSKSYRDTMSELQLLDDDADKETSPKGEDLSAELNSSAEQVQEENESPGTGISTRLKLLAIIAILLVMLAVYFLV